MAEPGMLAYLALAMCVPAAVVAFMMLPPQRACLAVLLGMQLFAPELVKFDLPLIPPLGKESLASALILLGCLYRCPRRLVKARLGRGPEIWIVVLMAAGVGTAMTNKDALTYGPTVLQALTMHDAISFAVRDLLNIGVPFFIGRAVFKDERDLQDIFRYVAGAGLIYTLFILVEVRLSPQWHRWIYGYHQHDFAQTIRLGGFRPMVFMSHGLQLGLFMLVSTVAAVVLAKTRRSVFGLPAGVTALYLYIVLVLCKSTGTILYSLLALPLLIIFPARAQLRFAALLCLLIAVYPISRAAGIFPADDIVKTARSFSEDRAQSIEFRFDQEELLLTKGADRVWFGWGGYNRGRVYDEWGKDISVPDGFWIIQLNGRGLIGTVAVFTLLMWPVLVALKRSRKIMMRTERTWIAGLGMMVTLYALDLLPNGLFSSTAPFFLTGALYGLCKNLARARAPAIGVSREQMAHATGLPLRPRRVRG